MELFHTMEMSQQHRRLDFYSISWLTTGEQEIEASTKTKGKTSNKRHLEKKTTFSVLQQNLQQLENKVIRLSNMY